jgi:hypothetical protein
VETALKEDKFFRGALPSVRNSRLEFLVIGPSADGAAAALTAAAAVASAAAAVASAAAAVASAAAAAVALAVETDSSAVLLDCIDMYYKILPRPTIASEVKAITVVKTTPIKQRLLL